MPATHESAVTLKRRDLIRAAPFVLPALKTRPASAAQGAAPVAGMNVILFLSDQERAIQHFPEGWEAENLPGGMRLREHGLSFERAFCNSCMCSPSRATLFTGYFPAQHGVTDTLSFGTRFSASERVLPRDLPNLATVFSAAGYEVAYKGKWHLSKPLAAPDDPEAWTPEDLEVYSFQRWNPPDAGENRDVSQFGGGTADNDGRIMTGDGPVADGREGVLAYLRDVAARQQPFLLVVSLVNPHDVLAYPRTWEDGGYAASDWLEGELGLPPTVDEDLASKPTAQGQFARWLNIGLGPLRDDAARKNYVNFYGNLIKATDAWLVDLLDTLDELNLRDDTLIVRTSDHGEMGMAHGGVRQKSFNAYEESLRVPLIYSNPRLFPEPRQSDALVSHVDLLPTLATLIGAPGAARAGWQGVDYATLILDADAAPVQEEVVFTYDDLRCAQNIAQLALPPNRIIALREERYKLARYYDGAGIAADQWELYDLETDPDEQINLAAPGFVPTPEQAASRARLTARLADITATRLQPLAAP
ncbi:MAG: sulfatase-like hydrolase/transferase [Thermomicrobiales bacterium]